MGIGSERVFPSGLLPMVQGTRRSQELETAEKGLLEMGRGGTGGKWLSGRKKK